MLLAPRHKWCCRTGQTQPGRPTIGPRELAGKPRAYRCTKELLVMDNAELLRELDELMAAFQAWLHKMVHQLAHEDDNQGN